MYKLSISTSGSYISACLHEEKLSGSLIIKSNQGSTNLLLNEINELLVKTNVEKKDLGAIYLDTGPGYYTGLRIGYSVAQGVGASLGIPIVPVNGLDSLAFAAHTSHRKICAIIDIKRSEFAFCTYKPVPGGVVRESEPEILNIESLKEKFADDNEKKLLVGNWDLLDENALPNDSNTKLADPKIVSAETIHSVGERIFQNNKFPNFNEIAINYMREPDVSLSQTSLEKKVEFND
jgi:tRNA threonylcarbamoyl adenosine modification protein YeaZ|tara:strand:+ start:387 stop:1091 length:705 start_codon:yes stop_codon:yes gene_type:complete